MKKLFLALALAACSAHAQSPFSAPGEPLDYETLTHKLSLELMRAGNHDPSGVNDYHFKVMMVGLLNSSEERNLPFEKRKQLAVEVGTFGDTKLDALSIWKPDEKTKDYKELVIEGNQIRELTARVMTEFQAAEPGVCVMVEAILYEKSKKFFFFGDDVVVAKASYYPIPPTQFDTPFRTNLTLPVTDDKGLDVRLAVRYEKAVDAGKGKKSATATATGTVAKVGTAK